MIDLSFRNADLHERMDDPSCNQILLDNTYRQFKLVNRVLSNWHTIYKKFLFPILKASSSPSILDIGFGGGDITEALNSWAKNDKLKINITGIETDPRALHFLKEHHKDAKSEINFQIKSTKSLLTEKKVFDIVISNHVLHHLTENETKTFFEDSFLLSRSLTLHSDIHRCYPAYLAFQIFGRLFRNSYILEDGLTSIRRSYTLKELEKLTGDEWTVRQAFPYRLIALKYHGK